MKRLKRTKPSLHSSNGKECIDRRWAGLSRVALKLWFESDQGYRPARAASSTEISMNCPRPVRWRWWSATRSAIDAYAPAAEYAMSQGGAQGGSPIIPLRCREPLREKSTRCDPDWPERGPKEPKWVTEAQIKGVPATRAFGSRPKPERW